ncbi:DNA cytosine methyltransferase [Chloroflexota bacterium]
MKFRLGELFSGPGGIALGAKKATLTVGTEVYSIIPTWANDNDPDTCKTYRQNICPNNGESVICRDVRKLDFSRLPGIDALAFGFPCNDFSVVGERKGVNGDFGPLYSYGVKALRWFKPMWFLAENVGGLRSVNDGATLKDILREIQHAGYRITPHLYRFEEYGVPQARRRVVIVGIRDDIGKEFKVPAPLLTPARTSREAIEIPPIQHDAPNHEFTKQSEQVIERLKHIKPGQNAFNSDLPESLRLNVKRANISLIYRRLDPKKPSYTVTGSGGGGTHVYHWKENRALTNRERARLQTFPDDFIFCGGKESVRRQIGMAMPPLAVRNIFEAIFKTIADVEYSSVPSNIAFRTETIESRPPYDLQLSIV